MPGRAARRGRRPGGVTRAARLVELPVGASEDRLAGSLDLERALTEGVKAFEPGLLAAAHRGVLYVDEVNLLHDHLVDLLLDAAALGTAYVEREGVSVRHAARFLLVGTMNPEEGELRPQLLDRFGLTVEVRGAARAAERAEVVRRRLAYEADPAGVRRPLRRREAAGGADRRCPAPAALGHPADAALREITDGLRGLRRRRPARRPGHRPRRDRARRLARPRRGDRPTTYGRRRGWPCRTAAGAPRSTHPAWTTSSLDDALEEDARARAARDAGPGGPDGGGAAGRRQAHRRAARARRSPEATARARTAPNGRGFGAEPAEPPAAPAADGRGGGDDRSAPGS